MDNGLNLALMLLLVGMFTVFVILLLVVLTGKVLIRFINRYFPESIKEPVKAAADITSKKIAAIISAVDIITSGKGRVSKIDKITKA